jgi:hypothetical protein
VLFKMAEKDVICRIIKMLNIMTIHKYTPP